MLELGQLMHAYDRDVLTGRSSFARAGETLALLNGATKLSSIALPGRHRRRLCAVVRGHHGRPTPKVGDATATCSRPHCPVGDHRPRPPPGPAHPPGHRSSAGGSGAAAHRDRTGHAPRRRDRRRRARPGGRGGVARTPAAAAAIRLRRVRLARVLGIDRGRCRGRAHPVRALASPSKRAAMAGRDRRRRGFDLAIEEDLIEESRIHGYDAIPATFACPAARPDGRRQRNPRGRGRRAPAAAPRITWKRWFTPSSTPTCSAMAGRRRRGVNQSAQRRTRRDAARRCCRAWWRRSRATPRASNRGCGCSNWCSNAGNRAGDRADAPALRETRVARSSPVARRGRAMGRRRARSISTTSRATSTALPRPAPGWTIRPRPSLGHPGAPRVSPREGVESAGSASCIRACTGAGLDAAVVAFEPISPVAGTRRPCRPALSRYPVRPPRPRVRRRRRRCRGTPCSRPCARRRLVLRTFCCSTGTRLGRRSRIQESLWL